MPSFTQFRYLCNTEAGYVTEWRADIDDAPDWPTTCDNDTAHSIDLASRTIVGSQTDTGLQREDGVLYAVPKPSTFGVEMCDRDFKLICSTYDDKALHTVVNGANGSVTYVAARSGAHGNDHTITVETGATGAGNESRALAVARAGDDITVTFGTDSNGDSVAPTALDVANLINNDYDVALHHLNAVPSGDGSGDAATVAQTSLAGGTTNSCEDLLVNTTTLKEESWGELTLIGVYKDDAGSMVECADQNDATTNAILSVWEYTAINPYTHDLLKYGLRDGFLVVDPALPAGERWTHRAYAIGAALIPGNLGGTIRLFDGYLGPAPNGVIDAESPQTTVMNPDVGPGTSSVRLYVYYPAGSTLSHVLRLVTYRPPGTF
jgi:hypothetical protein